MEDPGIGERIKNLTNLLHGNGEDGIQKFIVSHDSLLDALLALYAECNSEHLMRNKHVSAFVHKYKSAVKKIQKLRISVRDFEVKDVIGRGHFGEVQVVTEISTGTVYAMKTLRKSETLSQPDIAFFEEERDIMAQAASPWITQLHYAFQDTTNLYLVMEFHPGGDLLSLLARYDDVFEEKMAKFYLAEVTLAIDDLHTMGYVHRDIKPENVLLARCGHVKLADFGSAAKLSRDQTVLSKMPVGTPDYVSPELLVAMNSSEGPSKYGVEVDWWSLGICTYEMLYGKTPFTDDSGSMVTTYSNIMNYKSCLSFPEENSASPEAVSFIRGLLTDANDRLQFTNICCHPFFTDTDFQHLRDKNPPFVPTVTSQDDTSNFDEFEKVRPQPRVEDFRSVHEREFNGRDLPFVGFTYTKEMTDAASPSLSVSKLGEVSMFSFVEEPVVQGVTVPGCTTTTTATVTTSGSPGMGNNLEVKLTVKIQELQHVRERCHQLEETECSLKSDLEHMEMSFKSKDDDLHKLETLKSSLENDLEHYIEEYNKLSMSLEQESVERRSIEEKAIQLYTDIQKMANEASQTEDELLRWELEDLREEVAQLEVDRENLTRKVSRKQKQFENCSSQLETAQRRASQLQAKLDKERRKSREVQKQDLQLLENREDLWRLDVQERTDLLETLQNQVQDLQSELETLRSQELVREDLDGELRGQLATLDKQNKELHVHGRGCDTDRIEDLVNRLEAKDQEIKELQETINTYKLKESQYLQDNKTEEKIKEIIDRLDKHRIDERTWKRKERELNEKLQDLENRLDLYRSKGRLGGATPSDSYLHDRLAQYQQEVQEQKRLIRDLKDKVQSCIDNEKKTTSKESVLQSRIQELEGEVSSLQTEKRTLVSEGHTWRRELDEKNTQITEYEGTISLLNVKVGQLERRVKDLTQKEMELLTSRSRTPVRERSEERRLQILKDEKLQLEMKVTSLEKQLERSKDRAHSTIFTRDRPEECKMQILKDEKLQLESKVTSLERQLKQSKGVSNILNREKSEERKMQILRDEKLQLETKVTSLEKQLERSRGRSEITQSQNLERKVENLGKEKSELEEAISSLRKELERVKASQNLKENEEFCAETAELEDTIDNLRKEVDVARSELESRENHICDTAELEETIRHLRKELENIWSCEKEKESEESEDIDKLRSERDELLSKVNELEQDGLMEASQSCKFNEEKEVSEVLDNNGERQYKMDCDHSTQEKERRSITGALQEMKQATCSGYRHASKSKFSDLKQYNAFLETRVDHLQKELDQAKKNSNAYLRKTLEKQLENLRKEKKDLQTRIEQLEAEIEEMRKKDFQKNRSTAEVKAVQQEKVYLETQVASLAKQLTELKHQSEAGRKQATQVRTQLEQVSSESEKTMTDLNQKLHAANLSVSEARSQVSSLQRRERSLQEQLDGLQKRLQNGVRDIEDKLQQAQTEKRQAEEGKDQAVREKEMSLQRLEQELKLRKSQQEKVNRQYMELQERVDGVAKEKGRLNMELQSIKGEMATRTHQLELETKKVEKLKLVCSELEAQIVDLEALMEHYEQKETEWNKVRHKYECAVDEREEKLEGTNHLLQSEQKAKQAACDKVKYMRQKMDNTKAMHRMEAESLSQQLKEAHCAIQKLNSKIADLEETNTKLEVFLNTHKENLSSENREQVKLKEEISRHITANQELRESNLKLKHNLEEAMDKFELIFGEKVDLENIMEKLQGWHFLEKYRYESHSEQLLKLIDFLQTKKETKKKSKFSFKSKEGGAGSFPQWKDLNTALDTERKRCLKLQEQIDKLRQENYKQAAELLQLKGPLLEKVPHLNVPHTPVNRNTVSVLINSPSSQLSPIPLLTPKVNRQLSCPTAAKTPQPAKQRMHHNIPHKFAKGLNTRATKCAVCLGGVHFVKQAAKCQECRLVCHPKCMNSVQATCGLPTEYVQHFAKMMTKLKSSDPNRLYPNLELEQSINIEGWLKIPKPNKGGWEKKWVRMEGSLLMMYNDETDASPIDTFDLNPPNADVSVHSAVTTAELSSTVGTDLAYILRLEVTPHTTCWPGRSLYLMAINFSEKQRWVATLEAAVSACNTGKENRASSSKLLGHTEIHLEGEKRLDLNCSLALTDKIILLGAEEGLFAYSPNCGREGPVLVRFGGLDNIYQLTYIPALYLVLLITGHSRQILCLDKRVIEAKMREGNLDQCVIVPSQVVEETHGCTVFAVGSWNHAHYLCVGMSEKVVLMKYDPKLAVFVAKRDFNAPEPCSCICITNNYAIIGTYKYYRIDMEKMSVSEFVDSKDNSLAFAAFGAAIHHSFPLDVIRITDIGLPEEFLLCFHEFGVFVNGKGRRSRPGDMKWGGLPLGFAYKEPFLYVTYFNSIQAIQIPVFSQELKVRQMYVSLPSPRFLGSARDKGAVYYASTNLHATEIICFGGSDSSSPVKTLTFDFEKENTGPERDRQVRFISPEVESVRSLRRSRSNCSLESTSSAYSISSLQSVDTNSDWSPPMKRERTEHR